MPFKPLEEHFVQTKRLPAGRKVWVQQPAHDQRSAAVIFLDAEIYIAPVAAPSVMHDLAVSKQICPSTAIYVSHLSGAARHVDYTCNDDYCSFIVEDLLPWVFSHHPNIDTNRIVIAGLSLSGLEAAYLAMRSPSRFTAAICQSPSFWWESEKFADFVPIAEGSSPKLWISVGDKETDKGARHPPSGLLQQSTQIEGCRRIFDVLRNRGHRVSYRSFDGGHDPWYWKQDLKLALPWALQAV